LAKYQCGKNPLTASIVMVMESSTSPKSLNGLHIIVDDVQVHESQCNHWFCGFYSLATAA
jgi:hypothetical protein